MTTSRNDALQAQAKITAENIVAAGYFDGPVTELARAYLALRAAPPSREPTGQHIADCERDVARLNFAEEKAATIYRGESGHWVFVDELARIRKGILGIGIRGCIDRAMKEAK